MWTTIIRSAAVVTLGLCGMATAALTGNGQALLDAGQFAAAEQSFSAAAAAATKAGRPGEACDLQLGQAAALREQGLVDRAIKLLFATETQALRLNDSTRVMRIDAALGGQLMLSQMGESSEEYLKKALALATESKDDAAAAGVRNDLGNLYAGQGKTDAAIEQFGLATAAADRAGAATSAADARVNAVLAGAGDAKRSVDATAWDDARRRVDALPPSHHRGALLLALGKAVQTVAVRDQNPAAFRVAGDCFQAARQTADSTGDTQLSADSWGSTGSIYLAAGQPDDALTAARKACFFAQQARSVDAQWRYEWLLGQVLAHRGQADEAIDAYTRALQALRPIRHDLSIGLGNANTRTTFRGSVGPVYFELADLLLKRADRDGPIAEQADLRLATDAVEQFKSAELQDYFRDDCTSLVKSKQYAIDQSLDHAAVVYVIPLADRVETIVSMPNGRRRYRTAVGSAELSKTAKAMRRLLEYDMDYSYRAPAAKLYDWLIRPMRDDLVAQHIDTLVFVPDGELRTVPMAALYDKPNKRHLIEDFAVAVSPGLTLIDDNAPPSRKSLAVLAAGETGAVEDFPALPNVKQEMSNISSNFAGTQVLLDAGFRKIAFSNAVADNPYSIVHVASHGEFAGDASKTFVLTHDSRLTLDELQELLLPSQFRSEPIELLTLSACQTATGADGARAALGLGGVAVKSGARAALATLWAVDDFATSNVITTFYAALKSRPDLNKAQCLRLAQLAILQGAGDTLPYDYKHPRKWAPYLIIGNWK